MSWSGILLFVGGVAIMGFVVVDVLKTTMGEGGGPITRFISTRVWNLLSRRVSPDRSQWLAILGVAIVIVTFTSWVLLTWCGWTLVFSAHPDAVVSAQHGIPADVTDRIYFVGYVMSSLGIGDFVPQGGFWQILTIGCCLTGLSLITFAISYVMPVVQAAAHKRSLARRLWSLGDTPYAILCRHWRGDSFATLETRLAELMADISRLHQNHLTYPVLHHMHSRSFEEAIAVRLATMEEALSLVRYGVTQESAFDPVLLDTLRRLVGVFLELLRSTGFEPLEQAPQAPELAELSRAGIPVRDQVDFAQRLASIEERRRTLAGFVCGDGWRWVDVYTQRT